MDFVDICNNAIEHHKVKLNTANAYIQELFSLRKSSVKHFVDVRARYIRLN